jgi:hypothetical protein
MVRRAEIIAGFLLRNGRMRERVGRSMPVLLDPLGSTAVL